MKCKYCKEEKPTEEFEIANIVKGKEYRRKKCKSCKQLTQNIRRKKTAKIICNLKKSLECVRCGFSDYRALEFHHLDRSTKSFNISESFTWSFGKIQEEIEKCEILCANCHRIEHYTRE